MTEFLREYSLELSSIVFMIGLVMTVLAILRYSFQSGLPFYLKDILNSIGSWIVWMTVVGPIFLIGGGWFFFDGIKKRREFSRLLNTRSKRVFLRNSDRLEELAHHLTERHRNLYHEKKRELKAKKRGRFKLR
ncbi:MAG: DUF3198 domain-containing protein [Thermoplasmata archaeon]